LIFHGIRVADGLARGLLREAQTGNQAICIAK
jgi:hypothetical protein